MCVCARGATEALTQPLPAFPWCPYRWHALQVLAGTPLLKELSLASCAQLGSGILVSVSLPAVPQPALLPAPERLQPQGAAAAAPFVRRQNGELAAGAAAHAGEAHAWGEAAQGLQEPAAVVWGGEAEAEDEAAAADQEEEHGIEEAAERLQLPIDGVALPRVEPPPADGWPALPGD